MSTNTNIRNFFRHQAQTTPHPLALEVSHAKGSYIYDTDRNAYLDFVAGVSACSVGHCHPKVVEAIQKQTQQYLHVMVYGEYVQSPSVKLCKKLSKLMDSSLDKTYLTNSGTEAIEGSLKLARRVTGRSQIIAANLAYHGNTMGSMSVMGFEERKQAFRPLIPDVSFIDFNDKKALLQITTRTAAVILETIQGGAGFIEPKKNYLKKVKQRCQEVGALLILDEIQPGLGRTGRLFGYEHYGIVPDIVVMGKGLGGGLPIGAFTSSAEYMDCLSDNPKLGHITTFGGNPVIAASALATLKLVSKPKMLKSCLEKEALFRELLSSHPLIKEIRGKGLMLALIFENSDIANYLVLQAQSKGLILFWLLFEPCAVRITPPLTINHKEIKEGCVVIRQILDSL